MVLIETVTYTQLHLSIT